MLSLLRLPSRPRPVSNQVVAEGECKLMARNTELMTQNAPCDSTIYPEFNLKLRNMYYGTWRRTCCFLNEPSASEALRFVGLIDPAEVKKRQTAHFACRNMIVRLC